MRRVRHILSLDGVSRALTLAGVLCATAGVLGLVAQLGQQWTRPGSDPPAVMQPRPSNERAIAQLQRRVGASLADYQAYALLGEAYLQAARETGDPVYYQNAKDVLQAALDIAPDSALALSAMGAAALGEHRFEDAAEWAKRSLAVNSDNASAAASYGLLGDAQIELGQYQAAVQSYQRMIDLKPNRASYARVSFARELMGDPEGSIDAMRMALDAGAQTGEGAAWVLVHLGDLYFNAGRVGEATTEYEAALEAFDGYYVALAALGRARAAQGRYAEAIDLYARSVSILPQPSTLSALGDLYTLTGDTEKAQDAYETVDFIAGLPDAARVLYNRELSRFYADHKVHVGRALDLAVEDLTFRRDIYAFDTLAWALYENGRFDEAALAIRQAMSLGTQDAQLYYHAGMIHAALGYRDLARGHLERALAINPHFSLIHASKAREALTELRGQARCDC